jgi:thiosulfate/3-mercaptopyruvate sulfurtransferase
MKRITTFIAMALLVLISSCSFTKYAESDGLVLSAKKAMKLVEQGYILVDAQKTTSYVKEHVKGASNIERSAITVAEPVANTVAPASKVAQAAGMAGLKADSDIVIYDDNNDMDASRLFWTLSYYGHKGDIKIVSGGLQSLISAKADLAEGEESISKADYVAGSANKALIATAGEVEKATKDNSTVIIDVRTDEEYFAGTIPGSIHINYERNNLVGGALRPAEHIRILYKENGIMPEDSIIMYCKTSIRAANTYAALYNAGYRNLKVYDGAWLEWSALEKPVEMPERDLPAVSVNSADNS